MAIRVLFLCTANSARSQMAEAVLRHYGGDQFEVSSAGTAPTEVDQRTLQALQASGIGSEGLHAKAVDSLADQHFDFVISLCERAHNDCKHWPGSGVVLAWDLPDPKASDDPRAFGRVLHEVTERVRLFLLVNSKHGHLAKPVEPLQFFKALADETRLLCLMLIEQAGELCVCDLMAALEDSQPKISRHLAQLRKSGLLQDRRQGQWVYYRLHPELEGWMTDVVHSARLASPELVEPASARLNYSRNQTNARCG